MLSQQQQQQPEHDVARQFPTLHSRTAKIRLRNYSLLLIANNCSITLGQLVRTVKTLYLGFFRDSGFCRLFGFTFVL